MINRRDVFSHRPFTVSLDHVDTAAGMNWHEHTLKSRTFLGRVERGGLQSVL